MKVMLCSPENFAHLHGQLTPGDSLQRSLGLPVRVDRFVPTWKEYPRPKWWRRWFLREKQKPRERVFWVVDLESPGFKWPPYTIGPVLLDIARSAQR